MHCACGVCVCEHAKMYRSMHGHLGCARKEVCEEKLYGTGCEGFLLCLDCAIFELLSCWSVRGLCHQKQDLLYDGVHLKW